MISYIKIKTIGWIWIVLNQLCNVRAASRFPGSAEPDFNKWESDFVDGTFLRQSRLIWNHSAWCSNLFDCADPNGKIVKHQMCQYAWSKKKPSQCSRYKDFVLHATDNNRWEFLDGHNSFRETIAEQGMFDKGFGGSNLRRMKWDYSLEDMAANWAAQCLPGKDNACRRVQGHDYAGMLVELKEFKSNDTSTISAVMAEWAESLFSIDPSTSPGMNPATEFKHGPWDRGSQMVWYSTVKLGCASATYHAPPNKWYRIVVCYYAPPGNIPGDFIFKEGAPGSDCLEGTETRLSCAGWVYPSLCATPDDTMHGTIPERRTPRAKPPSTNCCGEHVMFRKPTLTHAPEPTQPSPGDQPRKSRAREERIHHRSLVITETSEGSGSNIIAGIAIIIATSMLLMNV